MWLYFCTFISCRWHTGYPS